MEDNNITITVTDVSGSKTKRIEVSKNVPMKRLIPVLAKTLELVEGEQYKAQNKRTKKEYGDEDTLASTGTENEDAVRLIPKQPGA